MKTYTVSLAVMMLLGEASTRTHTIRHEMPGAYDFIEYVDEDADEEAQIAQSIAESEKLHMYHPKKKVVEIDECVIETHKVLSKGLLLHANQAKES